MIGKLGIFAINYGLLKNAYLLSMFSILSALILGHSDLRLSSLQLVGKLNLGKLYEYIGFNKEIISRGRYAEIVAADHRPFRYLPVILKLIFGRLVLKNEGRPSYKTVFVCKVRKQGVFVRPIFLQSIYELLMAYTSLHLEVY